MKEEKHAIIAPVKTRETFYRRRAAARSSVRVNAVQIHGYSALL